MTEPAAGAGPALDPRLRKLGITRRDDLLLHLPLRYEDETRIRPIASLSDGETAQVQIEDAVSAQRKCRPRRGARWSR